MDVDHCVAQFVSVLDTSPTNGETTKDRALLLRHDVAYTHYAGNIPWVLFDLNFFSNWPCNAVADIVDKLQRALKPLNIPLLYSTEPSRLDLPSYSVNDDQNSSVPQSTASAEPSSDDYTILYIGGESLGLTNLLVTNVLCEASPCI